MMILELPTGVLDWPDERPVEPYGCHWFRDCGACGWETCVVDGWPDKYDSPRGQQLRGMGYAGLMVLGVSADQLGAFFDVPTESVLAETSQYGSMMEAVERRRMGEQVAAIAAAVGVSRRLVMYWCQGLPDIARARSRGRRMTGGLRMTGARVMDLQDRAEYVRRVFGCTNSGSPCQCRTDSVGYYGTKVL